MELLSNRPRFSLVCNSIYKNENEKQEIHRFISCFHKQYPSLMIFDQLNKDLAHFLKGILEDNGQKAIELLEQFFNQKKSIEEVSLAQLLLRKLVKPTNNTKNGNFFNIHSTLNGRFCEYDILNALELNLNLVVKNFPFQKSLKAHVFSLFKIIYRVVEIVGKPIHLTNSTVVKCRKLMYGEIDDLKKHFKLVVYRILLNLSEVVVDKDCPKTDELANFYSYCNVLYDLAIVYFNFNKLVDGNCIKYREFDLPSVEILALESIKESNHYDELDFPYYFLYLYSKEKKSTKRKIEINELMVYVYARLCMIRL